MNTIKLLTDSTSDLPEDLVKKYDIGVIPLFVNFNTQSYRDNVDIKPKELYRIVGKTGTLPTTSAPTPDNYTEEFQKYIDEGKDIILISLSSKISASYQNAFNAAAQFPSGRIKVIDSLSLSSGIGLLVLTAADCIEQGKNLEETAKFVQDSIGKVETEFIIDTVEYLHKGGRCSGLQMFLSSILKIHPIIKMENGSMRLAEKIRGGRQQVLSHLVNNVIENSSDIDPKRLFITHSEAAEDVQWVRNKLISLGKLDQVIITDASCVISSHCGPKTVGILYMRK
jgi:DegV family protein with EDD domain